jgi:hypothetical protein
MAYGGDASKLDNKLKELGKIYETCVIGVVISVTDDSGKKWKIVREMDVLWERKRPAHDRIWHVLPESSNVGDRLVCFFDYDIYGASFVCHPDDNGNVDLGDDVVTSLEELRRRFKVDGGKAQRNMGPPNKPTRKPMAFEAPTG